MAERQLDMSGSEEGKVVGFCEHANELSVSTKYQEFLDDRGLTLHSQTVPCGLLLQPHIPT
jgi:hypothetical protein